MNLGTVKWAHETKPNPVNCKNCTSKCAYDCAQLQCTIQHRTVLIISALTSRQPSELRCCLSEEKGQQGRCLGAECQAKCLRRNCRPRAWKCPGDLTGERECLEETSRGNVRIPMQDCKCLCVAVMICAILVNRQIHRHKYRQFDPLYY